MTTAANVHRSEGSHWYYRDGSPAYELKKKSGEGMKKVTLREAREFSLLPSVTTILKVLNKPALTQWLIEQAVLAAVTTPRLPGEADDAFIHRVMSVEKVQDEEAQIARDKGTAIHESIEACLNGRDFDKAWRPYVEGAIGEVAKLGKIVWTEKNLVGDGYAGRGDLLTESEQFLTLVDFKTSKTIPKESYTEHKIQTAAYAKTLGNVGDKRILTANIYISTIIPGHAFTSFQYDWLHSYEEGFVPTMKLWQFLNSYYPGGAQ